MASGVPPTFAISDPHVRAWCEAMESRLYGAGEPLRRDEVETIAADTMLGLLNGASPAAIAGVADPSARYQQVLTAVERLVTGSAAYQLLARPVQQIAPPTNQLREALQRIDNETSERIAAVAAEAAARGSGIYSEQTARETADDALQTQIDVIVAAGTSDTATILAALTAEQTARIDADSAEAAARDLLATQMRGTYTGSDPALLTTGLVYNERQARITAVSAVASDVSALSATVAGNTAAITAEQTARASADTAMSTSLSTLSSTVSGNTAAIVGEQTTRTNRDNLLAQALNTIWASIGGTAALIQDAAFAAISPAAVAATKWTQVQAAVTDPNTGQVNGASIKAELNAYASSVNSTLNTTWSIRSTVGGVVTGIALTTTAGAGSAPGTETSHFLIRADRLSLVNPSNSALRPVPFSVDGSGNAVFSGHIYAAGGTFAGALSAATGTFAGSLSAATGTFAGSLTAQVVNTSNIVGAAISTTMSSQSAGASTSLTISIPAGCRSVVVFASAGAGTRLYTFGGGIDVSGYSAVEPLQASISSPLGSSSGYGMAMFVMSDPPAGTYTFTVSRPALSLTLLNYYGNVSMALILTKR